MNVPYNYLHEEFKNCDDIFDEWKELIQTTDFTLGQYVKEFELIFSNYIGSKYCVSTNNGTDALILALKACGVGPGDEVITVTNTFYATVGAIVACGATPVLVDCDSRYQIDPIAIKRAITTKTKIILPVHWAGASPEMNLVQELAEENNLIIVEDACMGIGASIEGKSPGTFGLIGAFSMHPLKSLNVMGDGGMVVTDDSEIYNWMVKYRNHGMIDRDHIEFWGVNMRIQPLQAIVAKHRMRELDKTIAKRSSNAKYLDDNLKLLSDFITTPKRLDGYQETFALYMCLADRRDDLLHFLTAKGIEAKIHYPVPLHLQRAALNNCKISNNMQEAEMQSKRLITLPVHQYLELSHLKYMVGAISEFYKT